MILSILLIVLLHGGLFDVSKPYLTTYECEEMHLGTINLLDEFSSIRLELKRDGYSYTAITQDGTKTQRKGSFVYDAERKIITFDDTFYGTLKGDELSFHVQFGDQIFSAALKS